MEWIIAIIAVDVALFGVAFLFAILHCGKMADERMEEIDRHVNEIIKEVSRQQAKAASLNGHRIVSQQWIRETRRATR